MLYHTRAAPMSAMTRMRTSAVLFLFLLAHEPARADEGGACADDAEGTLESAIHMTCEEALAVIPTTPDFSGEACDFSLAAWLHEDLAISAACPLSCGACPGSLAPAPAWLAEAVHHFLPATAPGAAVLTADGLWSAIQHWDTDTEAGRAMPFMYSENEADAKYMVSAFLANANHESLSAFATEANFHPDFGINELIYDAEVGHCANDADEADPRICPGEFVQAPTDCTTSWGGEYGVYWGRGALQVTCRKGAAPDGGDYCPAYSDVARFYAGY
eukprot:SAG22_NODE_3252_length_1829_cov_1.724277_1_plen_273_part_10